MITGRGAVSAAAASYAGHRALMGRFTVGNVGDDHESFSGCLETKDGLVHNWLVLFVVLFVLLQVAIFVGIAQ